MFGYIAAGVLVAGGAALAWWDSRKLRIGDLAVLQANKITLSQSGAQLPLSFVQTGNEVSLLVTSINKAPTNIAVGTIQSFPGVNGVAASFLPTDVLRFTRNGKTFPGGR